MESAEVIRNRTASKCGAQVMLVLQRDFLYNARADVLTRALLEVCVFWNVVRLELLFPEDVRITIPRNVR